MGGFEWAMVGALATAIGVGGTALARLMTRLTQAEAQAARVDDLERDLVNHRVEVAREYASNHTLARLESKLLEALNRLGDRLDTLFENRGN